jgi:GNAT superfamily N-acetyltransferase
MLVKTISGYKRITLHSKINLGSPEDPFFILNPIPKKQPKVYPCFPNIDPILLKNVLYRTANPDDLNTICSFTDYWLAGKAYSQGIVGAGHDFFIPKSRHQDYLRKYTTVLAFLQSQVIGWAVRQRDGSLIHLLVSADHRGQGIGKQLLKMLDPTIIRSKSDQSTGDPLKFYMKAGYKKTSDVKIGKHKNIDLLSRM